MSTSMSSRALAPIGVAGNLFAFAFDVGRGLFRRPFQLLFVANFVLSMIYLQVVPPKGG